MVDLATTIWRDYATDGVPASGNHKPLKNKIREWGTKVEQDIASVRTVADRTALASVPTSAIAVPFDGSLWVLVTIASLPAEEQAAVTVDNAARKGMYVVSAIDATKAWKRQAPNYRPEYFYQTGDAGVWTVAIQAAIDALPASGGTIVIPNTTLTAEGIKVAGTSGNKSNVSIVGGGPNSRLVLPANSNLNVLEATALTGHIISGLRISGSKGNGGAPVRGPTKGMWTATTVYAVDDTVEVSSSDVVTTTVAASNLVYKCTVAHTSSAAFLTDKATKWTLVADPNFNTSDQSYRYRNGVYVDGANNVIVENCRIDACVYAGVCIGSGPVQTANAGPGTTNTRVVGNTITGCENGMAGGKWIDCRVSENYISNCDIYGIVSDLSTVNSIISDNTMVGKVGGSHGIFLYDAEKVTVSDNSLRGWVNGIVQDGGSILNRISGNVLNDITNIGIFSRGGIIGTINDNLIHACTSHGIQVLTASQISIGNNVISACGGDGINLQTVSGTTINGNTSRLNTGSGIEMVSCTEMTIQGNICLDNGDDGITASNTLRAVVVANRCYDSRAGGSKTQDYGIRTTGTSDSWRIVGNDLSANGTGDYTLVGSANYTFGNDRYEAAQKLGQAVVANSTNTVATLVPMIDSGGVTRYLLARNTI